MPPLNTTLIRGCSELQGPATQEWLWHGSDFVAPSLCSLLGPITPHRSFLLSFFLELYWLERGMKVQRPRHEEAMDTLAVPAAGMREVLPDRGIEDCGSGPPRSRRARETHWAFTTSWSEISRIIYLAEDIRGWGVFFYLFYILPVSPRFEPRDPGFTSEFCCCLSVRFFTFFQPCTLFALACNPLT